MSCLHEGRESTSYSSYLHHIVVTSSIAPSICLLQNSCFTLTLAKQLILQICYIVDAICGAIYGVLFLMPNCFYNTSASSTNCFGCFEQLILQIYYLMPYVVPSIVMFQLLNFFYNTFTSSTTCVGC